MTKKSLTIFLTLALLATLVACGAPNPKLAGNWSMTLKNYEQAVVEYQAALKEEPDSVTLLTGLGRAYYNLGQYDKASEAFLHATQVEDYPMASFYLGLSTIAGGDRQAGFELLKKFRYTGKTYVTDAVRDMATRLEAKPESTTENIAQKMFQAWDDGIKRQQEADRPSS